jgi:hypothetical protein
VSKKFHHGVAHQLLQGAPALKVCVTVFLTVMIVLLFIHVIGWKILAENKRTLVILIILEIVRTVFDTHTALGEACAKP